MLFPKVLTRSLERSFLNHPTDYDNDFNSGIGVEVWVISNETSGLLEPERNFYYHNTVNDNNYKED